MAIAAHLESPPAGGAARARPPRRTLRLETSGVLASGPATGVLVHNVSATGLLLESDAPLAHGERIEIDLPEAGPTPARVVWTSGSLFGCQFDSPISAAALSAAELRSAVVSPMGLGAAAERGTDEAFAARLHRLRKERGLTLSQVAEQLGVSKPTVWAWEQAKARPVESRLDALAQTLGVSRAELMPEDDLVTALREMIARSKAQIAGAAGIAPDQVRIMIEL